MGLIVGGLEALSEGGEGVPRGLKGEKSHLKAVYAQIILHSARGGVGGDSAPTVRPWWLRDVGGVGVSRL